VVNVEPDLVSPLQKCNNPEYKQHKNDSVNYCSQIIQKNPILEKWNHVLSTLKKDDLADCFLQGIWWLKTHKIINIADDLNIKCVTS
jgi:hypothetical protein